MTQGPEARLLRSVLAALDFHPRVRALRLNAGLTLVKGATGTRAIRGVEPGTPDVMVMLPGERVLWLELKAPKGKLTPKQRDWHEWARGMGHRVHVVRTVEEAMDAVEQALREAA